MRTAEFTVNDTSINVDEKLSEVFEGGLALTGERTWDGEARKHTRKAAIVEDGNPTGMFAVEHGRGFGLTMEAAVLRALYSHHIATTHNLTPFQTPTSVTESISQNVEGEDVNSRFNQLFDTSSEFVIAGEPDELYFTFETSGKTYRSVGARGLSGGAISAIEKLTRAATGHRTNNHLRSAGGLHIPTTLFTLALETE